MSVTVVQVGARMHYAVPRILCAAGLLDELVTDLTGRHGWPRLLRAVPPSVRPTALRRLLGRNPVGVPDDKVVAVPAVGLRYIWRLRRAGGRLAAVAAAHLAVGRELAEAAVRRGLKGRAVYAFNSAALPVFREARRLGLRTIYEQTIAPVETQWPLLREEHARWPGWEASAGLEDFFRAFAEVEREERELADRIVCGSAFVRDELAAHMQSADHCLVVPYGVDLNTPAPRREPPTGRPLRVLTVGTVGLRKGAGYAAAAARLCAGWAEFRWVGPIDLTEVGRKAIGQHVHLTGGVPRSEMAAQYRWADVFLLPSVCEGSATASYEAMAHGLPLVVTPNVGAPAGPEQGAVVPIRDPDAVAAALARFRDHPDEWDAAARAARTASQSLTVDAYGRRLVAVARELVGQS